MRKPSKKESFTTNQLAPLHAMVTSFAEGDASPAIPDLSLEHIDAHDLFMWAALISTGSAKLSAQDRVDKAVEIANLAIEARTQRLSKIKKDA